MKNKTIDIHHFNPAQEFAFDNNGLITAVVMDYSNNELLMVAHMNLEAFMKTCEKQEAYFYSRKRARLWKKGETSGNVLEVKEIHMDCDMDCVQLRVRVKGDGNVCHTGERSCFYRVFTFNGEKRP